MIDKFCWFKMVGVVIVEADGAEDDEAELELEYEADEEDVHDTDSTGSH